MAGVTERVRLATGILISPLRPGRAPRQDRGDARRGERRPARPRRRPRLAARGVRGARAVAWADRFQVFTDQLHACVALWTRGAAGRVPSPTVRSARPGASRGRCNARCRCGSESRRRPATSRSMRELGSGLDADPHDDAEALVAGIAALPAGFDVRADRAGRRSDDNGAGRRRRDTRDDRRRTKRWVSRSRAWASVATSPTAATSPRSCSQSRARSTSASNRRCCARVGPAVSSGCHCTARSHVPSTSSPSTMPSSAVAVTRRPAPTLPTAWWW